VKPVSEAEILFPVTCPVCSRQSLSAFRLSVVADALQTGQIRLYASCHVAGWDASRSELETIREYLDVESSADLQQVCRQFDLDVSTVFEMPAYIPAGHTKNTRGRGIFAS
jgi:hypothetical protein